MARLQCECDHTLSNSRVPNEIQYYAFSPTQWENLLIHGKFDVLTIPDPEGEIWRCPQCKRLHWFPKGSNHCQSYSKVSEKLFSEDSLWKNDEDFYHVFSDFQWDDLLRDDEVDFTKIEIQPFLLKRTETGLLILNHETHKVLTYQQE